MFRRATLRRDDHVAVAVLLVDQGRRAGLTGSPALGREQQDLRPVPPDVADLAIGLPVAPDMLVAEEIFRFAHLGEATRSAGALQYIPAVSDDDGYFDEQVAARYDESGEISGMFDPAVVDAAVDLLAELAGSGRALELGIGTGRIALPLARRGVPVHGIELSRAMTARLRAKPGGEDLDVTIGDFATTTVDGTFAVAYLVFNTIMNLTTQEEQVACFRNVAAQLEPGGCFLIEVGVPDLQRLPPGETVRPFHVSETRWGFDEYDVARQGLVSHHLEIVDGAAERSSMPFRYVWPAELDLMAELAGMKLRDRWSGWKQEPFESDSRKHVSVWQKTAV